MKVSAQRAAKSLRAHASGNKRHKTSGNGAWTSVQLFAVQGQNDRLAALHASKIAAFLATSIYKYVYVLMSLRSPTAQPSPPGSTASVLWRMPCRGTLLKRSPGAVRCVFHRRARLAGRCMQPPSAGARISQLSAALHFFVTRQHCFFVFSVAFIISSVLGFSLPSRVHVF